MPVNWRTISKGMCSSMLIRRKSTKDIDSLKTYIKALYQGCSMITKEMARKFIGVGNEDWNKDWL
jgi:hypothetical protein